MLCAVVAAHALAESGGLAVPLQIDVAHGAVPVLPDDEFDQILGDGGIVLALLVQEHDDVRILLYRARLAKVAELGDVVGALIHSARHLRKEQDGHTEFLGIHLHASGHFADFHLSALARPARAARGHELEIVDDDEVEPLIAFQSAALGEHVHGGVHGIVVDVKIGAHQPAIGFVQLARAGSREPAHGIHRGQRALRDVRQHTFDQKLRGHLEGEYRHRLVVFQARVRRYVERERRFAHRRSCRDEDELAGFQTVRHPVEGGEVGVDRVVVDDARLHFLYLFHRRAERGARVHEVLFGEILRDGIYLLFGVQQRVGAAHRLIAFLRDVVARRNDAADERIALYDVGVVLRSRCGRDALRKGGEIIYAARLVQLAQQHEPVRNGHGVHHGRVVHERAHGGKDDAVRHLVKVIRLQRRDELIRSAVVDEDGPEQG